MPSSALRPRSATEIVDAAFQIFRAHPGPLVMCAAVPYLPTLVLRLVLVREVQGMVTADASQVWQTAMHSLYTAIASVLSYAIMTAMLTICASQAYLGEEVDVGTAVRRVVPRLPALLAASLAVSVLTFLGFLCFFIPAVYLTARWFAVVPALLLEDRGPSDAMTRSAELSRGRKWHILNTLGLVLLIFFVLVIGLGVVTALTRNVTLQLLGSVIATVCVYPVLAITGVLLYYDARIQSEGLDIELMAEALGPTTAPLVS